jgi:hypothetical protein
LSVAAGASVIGRMASEEIPGRDASKEPAEGIVGRLRLAITDEGVVMAARLSAKLAVEV